MARRKQPVIADALLDQLLGGADPKTAFAKDGLLDELKKALAERALNAEMDAGLAALDDFAEGPWHRKYPAIARSWRRAWSEVIPFYAFPDEVRRIIYTTNAVESLNAKLRRAVRTRGHFPTDESAMKLLFLVLNLAAKEWKMSKGMDDGPGPVRHPL